MQSVHAHAIGTAVTRPENQVAMLNQARVCAPVWDPKQHAVHGAGKANCKAHALHNRHTKSKVETFLICSGENHRLIAATHVEIRTATVTVLAPACCHAAP